MRTIGRLMPGNIPRKSLMPRRIRITRGTCLRSADGSAWYERVCSVTVVLAPERYAALLPHNIQSSNAYSSLRQQLREGWLYVIVLWCRIIYS
jgi:hypothetical protein